MYFTIGAHPAFNVPVLPDTIQSQYHLTFNGEKELTYCLLDPEYGTAIPDKTYTLPLENNSCTIDEHMFDHDALVFDNGQITKAGIALPDGTPYIQGTKGYILQKSTANCCGGITFHPNEGKEEHYNLNGGRPRQAAEFEAFARALESGDQELCGRMQDTTIAVSRVLTVARRNAGIRFPCDH